jgi:hypothetical protein
MHIIYRHVGGPSLSLSLSLSLSHSLSFSGCNEGGGRSEGGIGV